jgi:hypothetical protein
MTQNAIIFILFVIAIVLVTVVVMLAISRTQEKNMRKSLALTLANQGNARSRYELWADDPAHVLQFDFLLNGVALSHGTAAPPQPGGQNLLTSPAIQTPTRTNGSSGSSGSSVSQAASKASGAAQSANGFANFIGEILDTLGNILPGSAGQSFLNMSENIRRSQASVQRVQRVEQRAEGVGEQFQGYATKVQGTTASTRSLTVSSTASSSPAASGAMNYQPVTPSHPLTPYVEPGSQVELGLRVLPLMRLKEDRVAFTISSRSLEDPDAKPDTQSGTVNFPGMTGIRYYLPYIIVGGVALLLILLLASATHVLG